MMISHKMKIKAVIRMEMRAGWAERVNSALVLTREMPGRPSEAAEWAAGH